MTNQKKPTRQKGDNDTTQRLKSVFLLRALKDSVLKDSVCVFQVQLLNQLNLF